VLSYKITHAFKFCFCAVLKLPADLSLPIRSFLLLRCSLSVTPSRPCAQGKLPVHPLFLVYHRNFRFVLGLARSSCLLLMGHSHSNSQERHSLPPPLNLSSRHQQCFCLKLIGLTLSETHSRNLVPRKCFPTHKNSTRKGRA